VFTVVDIAEWRAQFNATLTEVDERIDLEWPDPLPLFNHSVETLAPEILPSPLAEYGASIGKWTETPCELPILSALGVFGVSVAGKVKIQAESGYFEPSNLYVCTVLDSGNRKSAVLDCVTRPLIASN
jgi:putative DNA primase/helicase